MPNPTTKLAPTNMTAATVGTTAAQLLGFNPNRNGLIITNLHATQSISITNSQNASPVSLAAGTFTIPANTSVQFGPGLAGPNLFGFSWTDVVNAIASGAGTPCTLIEF